MHPGMLYLCPTPIGNLEDITLRVLRVLREADVVAAEDTRHSRKLLTHFEIHKPLVSYHEHNKAERGPELLQRLLAGENIALVSDAGMPGIADPGADLVRIALAAGVPVVPLPGANAALTSLIASGLSSEQFQFLGFLPKTAKKRRALLEEAASYPGTLIFYEAPHRLIPLSPSVLSKRGPSPQRRAALSMARANNNTAPRMGKDAKRNVLKF